MTGRAEDLARALKRVTLAEAPVPCEVPDCGAEAAWYAPTPPFWRCQRHEAGA